MYKTRLYTLLLLLIFCVLPGVYGSDYYRFFHPLETIGGEFHSVSGIAEDAEGIIWYSTLSGLYKFNGQNLERFSHNPEDQDSLINDKIQTLFISSDGKIWAGTYGGLSALDPDTGKFVHYTKENNNLAGNLIIAIEEDSDGNIWAGTSTGLSMISRADNSVTNYLSTMENSIPNDVVRDLLLDSENNLWIGTVVGLSKYSNGRFTNYTRTEYSNELPANGIMSIIELPQKRIAFGTWAVDEEPGGIALYNLESSKFEKPIIAADHGITGTRIYQIAYYDDKLWAGTWGSGLFIQDSSKEFLHVSQQAEDIWSLSHEIIYSMFIDSNGLLWIGTKGAGINIFDKSLTFFTHIHPTLENGKNAGINSIFCTSDREILAGSASEGLFWYDSALELKNQITSDADSPFKLTGNNITSILVTKNGNFWIGTDQGLNIFNPATMRGQKYTINSSPHKFIGNEINILTESANGNVWVGTYYDGAALMKYGSGIEKVFSTETTPALSNNTIRDIIEISSSQIWIATNSGLNMLDPEKGEITVYKSGNSGIVNDVFTSMSHIDGSSTIWAGTIGGGLLEINISDPVNPVFTHHKSNSDFQAITSVENDNFGKLWLSSENGLAEYDPLSGVYHIFNELDAIQSSVFLINSSISSNGFLYFGGVNGFNIFRPEDIIVKENYPGLNLENIRINNQPYSSDFESRIIIGGLNNTMSFSMAAVEYLKPRKIRYAYKLHPYNENWIEVTDNSNIHINLPESGLYVLKMRTTNTQSFWNPEIKQLEIMIKRPFFQQWYFFTLIGVLIILCFFFFIRIRHASLRKRAVILEHQVKLRTRELSKSNQELARALEDKDTLLMEVHHRVKNNLTIISSMINLQQDTTKNDSERNYLNQLKGRIMSMALVHEQLYKTRDYSKVDMKMYITRLLQEIESTFNTSHGQITIKTDICSCMLDINKAIPLGLVISELLTNAFKYAFPENNNGEISISFKKKNNHTYLVIKDTGVHFPADFSEKSGSLGRILVHELIKQIQGEISLDVKKKEYTIKLDIKM